MKRTWTLTLFNPCSRRADKVYLVRYADDFLQPLSHRADERLALGVGDIHFNPCMRRVDRDLAGLGGARSLQPLRTQGGQSWHHSKRHVAPSTPAHAGRTEMQSLSFFSQAFNPCACRAD